MNLVDTHCHLNHPPLCLDTDGVLGRAAAASVTRVIVPAYDAGSWDDLDRLAKRPGVDVAFGASRPREPGCGRTRSDRRTWPRSS